LSEVNLGQVEALRADANYSTSTYGDVVQLKTHNDLYKGSAFRFGASALGVTTLCMALMV